MTTTMLCPYCDNAPPYYLASLTVTKTISMNKIIELTDEVAALKKQLHELKKVKL